MYIIDLWSDVKYSILVAIKTLFLDLCSAVYKLIVYTFDIFFTLGEAKILDDPTIQGIYTRVGLILGLFMIFRLTFAGIQYLIDPDTMLDKQKGIGNIVKKVLLVVLLLGSTQYIFKKAYELQHLIIEDNVLSRIILQESGTTESKGGELAYQIFIPFFQPNDAVINYCNKDGNCDNDSNNYEYCISQVKPQSEDTVLKFDFQQTPPDMRIAYMCLSESIDLPINGSKKTSKEFIINFEGFVALAVAIVVLWTIMTYTIQVGVRAMQLAYLQLIAPIPIMMYLTPKGDETLKKWGQQCAITFFDFFIRAAIFYFIILVINALETATLQIDYNKSWALGYLYMKVVLIIALLTFAKKVPALLKEIFPSMGGAAGFSYGLSAKKIFDDALGGAILKKGIGRAYGAAAVGFGTVQKNARKGIGKIWDTQKQIKDLSGELAGETDEKKKKKLEAELNAMRKKRSNLVGRATFGAVASGFGGARRGLSTTNKSQRKAAVNTSVAATQARQKLHDEGYGSSIPGLLTPKGRQGFKTQADDAIRGFFGRDQTISEMIKANEAASEGIQKQIGKYQEGYDGHHAIEVSKTHPGRYMVTDTNTSKVYKDENGNIRYFTRDEIMNGNIFDEPSGSMGTALSIADLNDNLAKVQGAGKALRQKADEQKAKNGQ